MSVAKVSSKRSRKEQVKRLLGELPFTAELRSLHSRPDKRSTGGFLLKHADKYLDEWLQVAGAARAAKLQRPAGLPNTRKILVFTTLRYWTEHAILLSSALAGLGHDVTLAYLPFNNWKKPLNRFDLRRTEIYVKDVLRRAEPLFHSVSFSDGRLEAPDPLSPSLAQGLQDVSIRDVQYTRQVEDVTLSDPLYHYRLECNTHAARAALAWLQTGKPDLVITPNGSILEMGAVFQVARHLDIPTVTYEFGEQRGRIWLTKNEEVMQQNTGALWQAYRSESLRPEQWDQIRALAASRQGGRLWENFSRLWQDLPAQGGEQARQALGLDSRPVFLLPANVIGDSLTLGRQVFSQSMTDWLLGTVRYFASHPEAQLVVRIHPGERYTTGPSVADVLRSAIPNLGEDPATSHIHLVAAGDPINTYDLIEAADMGLVYTTTTGMEAVMSGLPVIAAGQTHYRGKGFTIDPATWEEYIELLDRALVDRQAFRPSREQVELAWTYAYRFFFDYPLPFPWHMVKFWKDLNTSPLQRVLSTEGQAQYGAAFAALSGEDPFESRTVHPHGENPGVRFEPGAGPAVPAPALDGAALTTKQQVRQFYDQIGWQKVAAKTGAQDEIYENALYEDLRPVSADYIHNCRLRILRHLPSSGQILLDAGSGPVQYPEYIEYSAGYGKRLCMDISMLALVEARKRLGEHGLYVVADIANLPFKTDAFDGVVSLHTIHHLPQDEHLRAYGELYRVLKPDQRAVIVVGWRKPLMTRILNAPHRLQKWLKGKRKALSGRARKGGDRRTRPEKQPGQSFDTPFENVAYNPENGASQPKGTFVDKYNAAWLIQQLAKGLPAGSQNQILAWRSLGGRTLRMYIHPRLAGRFWLRLLYRLEERFPRFFGEHGAYPMIILSKNAPGENEHAR